MPIIVTPVEPAATFSDLLLPELPGCTVDFLNLHLREVARKFCDKTLAWRMPFTAVNLVAGQADYTLVPGVTQAEVVKITKLTINSELLWDDTDRDEKGMTTFAPKYPRNQPPFTLDVGQLTLSLMVDEIPTASVAGGLVIVGALKPTADASILPDFLLNKYSEALRYGTLSRLMLMAKKPWTDRALGAEYAGEWRAALNFAAYQGAVGNTREHLRTKQW